MFHVKLSTTVGECSAAYSAHDRKWRLRCSGRGFEAHRPPGRRPRQPVRPRSTCRRSRDASRPDRDLPLLSSILPRLDDTHRAAAGSPELLGGYSDELRSGRHVIVATEPIWLRKTRPRPRRGNAPWIPRCSDPPTLNPARMSPGHSGALLAAGTLSHPCIAVEDIPHSTWLRLRPFGNVDSSSDEGFVGTGPAWFRPKVGAGLLI
jgi:hypothetical protein